MQLINYNSIFDFIIRQETMYKSPIPVNEKWDWSMKDHILTTELYLNGRLLNGKDDFTPTENIILPILNLNHRTEDIEAKEVQIYVDDAEKYHLSFLVKKYHDDVFVKKHDLDSFFDELNVSRIDYGAGLSKLVGGFRETVPLQSIAFCDQTDILSGPIGLKHYYSPDQLLEMADVGWGDENNGATISLEDLILISREERQGNKETRAIQTPGKYIEIYEVHGNMPKKFADPNDDSGKYESRLFIVAFYQKNNSQEKEGVILYTAEEKKSPFKLTKRDPIHGRALGRGGAEELFEDYVWNNYSLQRKVDMLDAASKTIMITQDSTLVAKHPTGLKDMENMEFIDEAQGGNTRQLDTTPRNINLFTNFMGERLLHAKNVGGAEDPLTGKEPTSGTPFASLQAQIQQGMGLHDYRRGQYAKHLEEIYNDDFIPEIIKEITQGAKWLSELDLEDLQYVTDRMVTYETNRYFTDQVINGNLDFTQEDIDAYKEKVKMEFQKKGSKHFIEILKGEFKGVSLAVKVVVAGKSKNLAQQVDKLSNMVRFVFSTYNPQTGSFTALDDPRTAGMINDIWESSGFSPKDFSQKPKPPMLMQPMANQPTPSPMQPLPPQPQMNG